MYTASLSVYAKAMWPKFNINIISGFFFVYLQISPMIYSNTTVILLESKFRKYLHTIYNV